MSDKIAPFDLSAFKGYDETPPSEEYVDAMEHLIVTVQLLFQARDIDSIAKIVRTAARNLFHADGATFILREGDDCFYYDEDAISPLWKGQRFPMKNCISGWVMLHERACAIENIYADGRIPADLYRQTFVKSLTMVPMPKKNPIGAIGVYWAQHHKSPPEQVALLQALAHIANAAMENAALYAELRDQIDREKSAS